MSDDGYQVLAGDDQGAEAQLKGFPLPDPAESPVVFLGYDDKYVIFALPEGEIRKEPAARIAGMLKVDIYCCREGQQFLNHWRTLDEEAKFSAQTCAVWFNRQCRAAGKWDNRRQQRSLGVWRGEGPGEVVLHKGDEIWRYQPDGTVRKQTVLEALRDRTGPLYKLFPPAPRPGDPATSADGHWFRKALDMWRFEALGDEGLSGADVVAGYLMAALLGGVPPFRVHVLMRALQGSGKTTLMMLVNKALSALAGPLINSFTDAGWRSDIAGMARPMGLDEAESAFGDGGPGPVEQILDYLRVMATGDGLNRKMGGMDGGMVSQTAVSAVIMAAIQPPPLGDALASRVAEINLLPLSGADLAEGAPRPEKYDDAQIHAAWERAEALAPAFLGRALEGAERFASDMAVMKKAITEVMGQSPRTADMVASLAAGRRLLMFDAPLTPREAEEEAAFWRPLLDRRQEVEAASNPGADLLGHIMAFPTGQHSHSRDRRLTVGDIIAKWANNEDVDEGERELKTLGLRLYAGPGPGDRPDRPQLGPWLLVSNKHAGLERMTARTQWGNWRATLGYLAHLGPAYAPLVAKPLKYGPGNQQRGLAVPLAPWLEKPMSRVPASVPAFVPWEGIEDAE